MQAPKLCTTLAHRRQIATAEFDNPTQAITTTATWFNLSVTAPLVNCPQLPHNSSVWVSIVPKAPITLPTPGVFYDGIIWLGAQVGQGNQGRAGQQLALTCAAPHHRTS